MPIVNRIASMQGEISAWRRDIHAHPELLYDVQRTAATVLPIVYMGVLDGHAYSEHHALLPRIFPHGVTGIYLFDGGLSLIACALMAVILLRKPWTSS